MLLNNIQIANAYPNEKIDISFNEITPELTNARFGVRFRYFYYDTWDGKINFRRTNDYTLVSNNTDGDKISAICPTNFLNPNDLSPFRWNVGSEREYLYLTVLGGLSSVTVYPTHPFPRITKNSDSSITLDVGVISASAFGYEVQAPEFRKLVKNSNFSSFASNNPLVDTLSGYATLSNSRKNSVHSRNYNYFRIFNSASLSPNIISNSFRIDIPVVTSTNVTVDTNNQIFVLSFYNDTYSNNNFNFITNNFVTNLSCLESEALTNLGITAPYTVQAAMNDKSGGVLIELKPPLYIMKNSDITVYYETSAAIAPGGVQISKNSSNNFTVNVIPGVYPNTPVYLFNYNFVSSTKDLFTVTFVPSSNIVSQNVSSIQIETVMTENYYQNTYNMPTSNNIMFKRFIETSGDTTLLAYDPSNPSVTYISEQWFDANGKQTLVFRNNGKGNKHKVRFELQSANGAIFREEQEYEFILNKNKVVFNLILSNSTDTTAVVEANIFPTPSDEYKVKWAADPPENVIFRDRNENVLSANTLYPFQLYASVSNLGVDRTKIIMYSEEFNLSASTFWTPPVNAFGNAFLEIKGTVNDKDPTSTSSLSAFINRNGYSYRIPKLANIIWDETANDERGSLKLYTKDFSRQIKETSIYAASENYTVINAAFSTVPVPFSPKQILFNISCNVFREDFDLSSTKMFWVRQYPSTQYLFIDALKSGDTKKYRSDTYRNVFYTSSGNLSLSAIFSDLNVNYNNLFWKYSLSNGSTGTATGSSLNLMLSSASACVTLSALDATPIDGNFKKYNFSDTICFFLNTSAKSFDYIGIPTNLYVPTYEQIIGDQKGSTSKLSFTNNSYLNSQGMSAYKPCHTEVFQFSASPGFSTYVWKIGNVTYRTNNNIASIPLTYSNVSANNVVFVSAYNSVFLETDPVSIFNSASSNNSNIFREHVNFYDFPTPSFNISLTNDYVNVDKYSDTPILNCEINSNYISVGSYNASIVLSSPDFIQTKNLFGTSPIFSKTLNIGIENKDFIIKENSVNNTVVFLTGSVGLNLPGYDYCTEFVPFTSNFVNLTVYNGPNLYLYTNKNIVSAGEEIIFYNGSNVNFDTIPLSEFQSFIFDNGEGNLQTSLSAYLKTTYSSEGPKTPSLTGILSNGTIITRQWSKMIFVKNNFQEYDSAITREFYKTLTLPYSLEQTLIPANSWQFANTWNTCFDKLRTNIAYLSAACSINNINFPKADGGFLGSLFGNFKWHTNYTANSIQDTIFKDLRSAQAINSKLLIINENNVQIYNLSETPSLLYSFNRIGDGEILEIPVAIRYNSSEKRLFILDKGKSIIFVCNFDIDNPQDIQITHYWGGVGERTDRTKLNNPVDFCVDSENRLFIVDKDSYLIKVYNKNINWLKNIQLPHFSATNRPVSISETNGNICVLTEDYTITIFDYEENIINSFNVPSCSNATLNQVHEGIIYTIIGNIIEKYSFNGTKISTKTFLHPVIDLFFDQNHLYVLTKNYVYRIVDFIEIDKIIDSNEDKAGFSWDNINISESEFVTSYIYNDSFQKIKDNLDLLNSRITQRIYLDLDEYGNVINQYTNYVTPSPLSALPIFIGTNEPVLYDTVNRNIINLYRNVQELKTNIDVFYNYPNYNDDLRWLWKYHIVDFIQRPSLNKNPISWIELRSERIFGNTSLSGVSSWCSIREGIPGNHSELCWNFQYTQCNSYFPITWESTECDAECSHVFSWEDLEKNCCRVPDFVFGDCVSVC